jgi:hypothetical protein
MVKWRPRSGNLSENDATAGPQPRPVRNLVLLGLAFIAGLVCWRCLWFTQPLLNAFFVVAVLALPFLALRPLSQLPGIPKVIGRIALTPVLILSPLLALVFVACGDLQHRLSKESCLQEVARIDQAGYSVHLLYDLCGGPAVGVTLFAEQRMPLLPGLYFVRSVDVFDEASEGNLSVVGPNQVRVQIPRSSWHQEIDRVYHLKPHVYF